MNSVDYTKKLAQERDYFQKSIRDQRRDHERDMAGIKKSNEIRNEKRAEAYKNDVSKIEENVQKNWDVKNKEVNEELYKKKLAYKDSLDKLQKEHSDRTLKNQTEFRDKIDSLDKEFQNSLARKEESDANIRKYMNKNYNEKTDHMRRQQQDEIGNLSDKMSERMSTTQKKFVDDKVRLAREFNDDIRKMKKSEAFRRNQLKEDTRDKFADLQNSYESNTEGLRKTFDRNTKAIKENSGNTIDKFYTEFSKMNEELRDKAREEAIIQSKENTNKLKALQREHIKKERLNEMEEANKGDASIRKYAVKLSHDSKLDNLEQAKVRSQEEAVKAKKEANKIVDSMSDDLKDFKTQTNAEQKIRENQIIKNNAIDNMNQRRLDKLSRSKAEDKYKDKIMYDQKDHETQLNKLRKENKNEIQRMNERFYNNLADLRLRNENQLYELKAESDQTKKQFFREVEKRAASEKFDLRKQFGKKLENNEANFNRQMNIEKLDQQRLKNDFLNKIAKVRREADEAIETQKKQFQQELKASKQAVTDSMKLRDAQNRAQLDQVHAMYGQKLARQNEKNTAEMNQVTLEYESRLSKLLKDSTNKLNMAKSESQRDKQLLTQSFQAEIQRLTNQYESKIQTLQQAHSDEMNRFKTYMKYELDTKIEKSKS